MVLYEFYGDGCKHCENMAPKVEKLEEQEDVEVEQLEVWSNQENADKQAELDAGKCGGVPFFFNTETDNWICGEATLKELKEWADV